MTLPDFDPMSMLNVDVFSSSFNPIHPEAVSHQSALSTIHEEVPASRWFVFAEWNFNHNCSRVRRPDRSGTIKRELILEILGTGSLTEREILRQIGDNRYSREIVRKLLQDGLIHRVGKVGQFLSCTPYLREYWTQTLQGGAKDPYRYVVAADSFDRTNKASDFNFALSTSSSLWLI